MNTDRRTFLVTFLHRTTNCRFIFQEPMELKQILEKYDQTGIESIKEFNPVKGCFKRLSKADFLAICSWETEAILYFKSHYFFK